MTYHLIAFCIGFVVDLLAGDPLGGFHIVVWIGREISLLEKALRRLFPKRPHSEFCGGLLLVVFVCTTSYLLSAATLKLLYHIHFIAGLTAESFLCWQCLAMRSLKIESMKVYKNQFSLENARSAVSRIVGRDTDNLDFSGVFRACVETIAENSSDGEIAPMLYLAIGGAPLGVLYKAINTMDSMLGYKNERYFHFGKAAARLDDAVNLIPSRIAAFLMGNSAGFVGLDRKNAFCIFCRDRLQHSSPNSAQTESVFAGALHIQLGGTSSYFGKTVAKPTIGDDDRPVEAEDIIRADRLLYAGSTLCFILCALVKGAVILLC